MFKVQAASLEWALTHALKVGDTDILPWPFEYHAIRDQWDDLKDYLADQNIFEWQVRPLRSMLSPKGRYGFRVVTQLDPLDFLLYTAAVYEIGNLVEASRIPKTDNVVFSYRFAPDLSGWMYDRNYVYGRFAREAVNIAQQTQYSHVAMADISDFYHRVYHHRLENALDASVPDRNRVKAVMHFLSGWNGTETYGIPVGSDATRLLAEATLVDVDTLLVQRGLKFVRYVDDYCIFCESHGDGYAALALLADYLFRMRGLTLQAHKTKVLTADAFVQQLLAPKFMEFSRLNAQFEELARKLGLDSPYERIEYSELTPGQKAAVDALNLAGLLRDQIGSGAPDLKTVRFILLRLGQLGDASVIDDVLGAMDLLYPVLPSVVTYLNGQKALDMAQRRTIGEQLISLLEGAFTGQLEYYRVWLMDVFAASTEWGNASRFTALLHAACDNPTRRKLILAMGRVGCSHWFQARWRDWQNEPPWCRRALIAAASCMPRDARNHWYDAIKGRLDPLEKAVAKWAKRYPFGSR